MLAFGHPPLLHCTARPQLLHTGQHCPQQQQQRQLRSPHIALSCKCDSGAVRLRLKCGPLCAPSLTTTVPFTTLPSSSSFSNHHHHQHLSTISACSPSSGDGCDDSDNDNDELSANSSNTISNDKRIAPVAISAKDNKHRYGTCAKCNGPVQIPGLTHSLCAAECGWVQRREDVDVVAPRSHHE